MAKKQKKDAAAVSTAVLSKKTMDLAYHAPGVNPLKLIIIAVILIALALVGVKFGLLDILDKRTAAQTDLTTRQQELAVYATKLADYDKVADQYGRYSYGWLTDAEAKQVLRADIFNTIQDYIIPNCIVEKYNINANTVSFNISGITLDQAREIINILTQQPNVQSANVSSVTAKDEGLTAAITMQVVFTKEAK